MKPQTKTIAEINARLARGDAVVMTAQEVKAGVRQGKVFGLEDVDVVTTATHGIMSGTAAAFSVPVAERGVFGRAKEAWLNGVPGFPGPAPNERLGYVDLMVYGTTPSRDDAERYGGGHLFRDMAERREVEIEVLTDTGHRLKRRFTLDDLAFARMYNLRNAFRSYMAFGNFKTAEPVKTIFCYWPMARGSGITVIGSGEVNPIQNDPELRTIGVGSAALVNNALGIVVGGGTMGYGERANLSIVADMFDMEPKYMGGVRTSDGVEVLNAVSIPIPIIDEAVLAGVVGALDEKLKLPVADVSDRLPIDEITYADVWQRDDLEVHVDPGKCCDACRKSCAAAAICPVRAIDPASRKIDFDRCTRCGACAVVCTSGAFRLDLGAVTTVGERHPITFRTSDRLRALELAQKLKQTLLARELELRERLMPIKIRKP